MNRRLIRRFKELGRLSSIFLSGAITVLAFAPFSVWPLALLTLAYLFFMVRESYFGEAFFLGWLFSVGMFLAGLHWTFYPIGIYGAGGVFGGIILTIIFAFMLAIIPAFSVALSSFWCRYPSLRALVVLPVLWGLFEWVRGWLFTGFPWLLLGHSQIDSPVSSLVPLGGGYLLGLFAALSAGAIAFLIIQERWWRVVPALLFVFLGAGCAFLLPAMWAQPVGETMAVSVVQGNIAQENKWKPSYRQLTLDRYRDMSEPLWQSSDVIVWPETAVPDFLHYVAEDYLMPLKERALAEGKTLILGIPVYEHEGPHYFNAVLALGEEPGIYRKRHLVPFGEYLPLRSIFGDALDFLGTPHGDFTSGSVMQKPLIAQGRPVAASVCFEIVFGDEVRHDAAKAAWLVNVSNDGWFGRSIAPHQHFQISRMRALETNRDLVRATNTGISAIIGADGHVKKRSPQFEQVVMTGEVQPRQGITPFVEWGDVPYLLISGVLLFGALVYRGLFPE